MKNNDNFLFARLEREKGYDNTRETNILNPYVDFVKHKNTHNLYNTLVSETIQMRGLELYYLPREYVSPDLIFGEDVQSKFTKAWKIAAYLETFDSYEGQNSFFSKFDLQSNDEITITINPELFKHQSNGKEPKMGDLLYFILDNSLFEITWIEPYNPFYQTGVNTQRRIIAQKFIYSNEEINPELQENDYINIPEFSELELEPIKNLDGLVDTNLDEFSEVDAINKEADEYVWDKTVINGVGINPFDEL